MECRGESETRGGMLPVFSLGFYEESGILCVIRNLLSLYFIAGCDLYLWLWRRMH